MKEDARLLLRLALSFLLTALLFLLAFSVDAAEVCPEQGKVESVVDGDLDGIVLDAGVEVCIKGGQVLMTVTADGTSTLAELLGTGQNVSHYTVLEVTSSTTSTTVPSTTTTIVVETTTTSGVTTTTTFPETTTTPSTTPSTEAPTTTVLDPTTTTVVATTTVSSVEELPFTGAEEWLFPLGLVLLASGGYLLRRTREQA